MTAREHPSEAHADVLLWSKARHRMLREVSTDRDFILTASFAFDHNSGQLTRGETRVLGTLRHAGLIATVPQEPSWRDQPVVMTDAGTRLLTEWDSRYLPDLDSGGPDV